MRPLLLAACLALAGAPALASGKSTAKSAKAQAKAAAAQAELQRLREQLRGLAGRSHWSGVDELYQRMVEVDPAALTLEDHLRGIEAAEALGRPDLAWPRVRAALTLSDSAELIERYARLSVFYGEVSLRLSKDWTGTATLEALPMPLDPVQRRVIEAAQEGLAEGGSYTGLLPLGMYRLGGTRFSVAGGPVVEVVAEPAAED